MFENLNKMYFKCIVNYNGDVSEQFLLPSINFSSSKTGNLVPLLPDLGIGNMLLVFFGTLGLLFIPVPVEIELSDSFGFRWGFASL